METFYPYTEGAIRVVLVELRRCAIHFNDTSRAQLALVKKDSKLLRSTTKPIYQPWSVPLLSLLSSALPPPSLLPLWYVECDEKLFWGVF